MKLMHTTVFSQYDADIEELDEVAAVVVLPLLLLLLQTDLLNDMHKFMDSPRIS